MIFPLGWSKDILKDCVSENFYEILWKKRSSILGREILPRTSMVYNSNNLQEIQKNSMLLIVGCFSMNKKMCLCLIFRLGSYTFLYNRAFHILCSNVSDRIDSITCSYLS